MSNYQTTVIVGHVGRDPSMRYTKSGAAVCSFSVAVSRRWKDRGGEPRETTTWFRVTTWGRLAETVNDYVRKGMLVLVDGDIDASAYLTDDGHPRAVLELTARYVVFLDGKPFDSTGSTTESTWVKEYGNDR